MTASHTGKQTVSGTSGAVCVCVSFIYSSLMTDAELFVCLAIQSTAVYQTLDHVFTRNDRDLHLLRLFHHSLGTRRVRDDDVDTITRFS